MYLKIDTENQLLDSHFRMEIAGDSEVQKSWVQVLALTLISWMTLDKLFSFFVPWILVKQRWWDDSISQSYSEDKKTDRVGSQ